MAIGTGPVGLVPIGTALGGVRPTPFVQGLASISLSAPTASVVIGGPWLIGSSGGGWSGAYGTVPYGTTPYSGSGGGVVPGLATIDLEAAQAAIVLS
jgi:hypothetical protein